MQKLFQTWEEALAFTRSARNASVTRSPNGNGFRVDYDDAPDPSTRNEAHEKEIGDLLSRIDALSHIVKEKEHKIVELYSQVSDLSRNNEKITQDVAHLSNKCEKQSAQIRDLEAFKARENLVSGFFSEEDLLLVKRIVQKREYDGRKAERVTKDCKCLGTNSNCSFCSGRGYYITDGNGEIKN